MGGGKWSGYNWEVFEKKRKKKTELGFCPGACVCVCLLVCVCGEQIRRGLNIR